MKTTLITMSILSALFQFSAGNNPLEVGAGAPVVTALDQDGNSVELNALYPDNIVLVYFFPKADTPGCTAQACSLRDSFAELADRDVTVIGVSKDKPASLKKFKEKHRLPFTLLSDTEGQLSSAFGVKTFMGFTARQSFLIARGKIAWRDLSASTAKQAEDILAILPEIEGVNESPEE